MELEYSEIKGYLSSLPELDMHRVRALDFPSASACSFLFLFLVFFSSSLSLFSPLLLPLFSLLSISPPLHFPSFFFLLSSFFLPCLSLFPLPCFRVFFFFSPIPLFLPGPLWRNHVFLLPMCHVHACRSSSRPPTCGRRSRRGTCCDKWIYFFLARMREKEDKHSMLLFIFTAAFRVADPPPAPPLPFPPKSTCLRS